MPEEIKEAFVKDRSKESGKMKRGGFSRNKKHQQGQKQDFGSKDPKYPKTNDAPWYFKYPSIAKDCAKIPFNHRNGAKLLMAIDYTQGGSTSGKANFDPIAVYDYLLTPGIAASGDDAINITSKAAWKMLNRRYRGNRPYQQSDFGIIQFAIVDFMSSLAEAERIYGLLQYYALNNKQVPDALLLSLGYLPETFNALADFRIELNKLVLKARTLCLVRGYSLLDHALLLAANVFKDKDTNRAQLFAFRRAGYWIYDPTNPNGSALLMKDYRYTYTYSAYGNLYHFRSMDDVIHDLKDQLNALLDDDDVDQICSDILAFYGNKEDPAELVTISSIPEDYCVKAIYSSMINRQVHNAMFFGNGNMFSSSGHLTPSTFLTTIAPTTFGLNGAPVIYQENNVIKFNLSIVKGTVITNSDTTNTWREGSSYSTIVTTPVLDTDLDDPNPEDVMEMTRFTCVAHQIARADSGGAYHYRIAIEGMPSTLILSMAVYKFQSTEYTFSTTTPTNIVFTDNPSIVTLGENSASALTDICIFDWHPIVYNLNISPFRAAPCGDLDNYVAVTSRELIPLHEAAILSEFKNPIVDTILKED